VGSFLSDPFNELAQLFTYHLTLTLLRDRLRTNPVIVILALKSLAYLLDSIRVAQGIDSLLSLRARLRLSYPYPSGPPNRVAPLLLKLASNHLFNEALVECPLFRHFRHLSLFHLLHRLLFGSLIFSRYLLFITHSLTSSTYLFRGIRSGRATDTRP